MRDNRWWICSGTIRCGSMVRSGSALGTRALEAVGQTPKPIVFDGKAGDGWFEKAYHQKEIGTAVRCDVPDAWSDTEFGEYLFKGLSEIAIGSVPDDRLELKDRGMASARKAWRFKASLVTENIVAGWRVSNFKVTPPSQIHLGTAICFLSSHRFQFPAHFAYLGSSLASEFS
jgi:hypothetical protein